MSQIPRAALALAAVVLAAPAAAAVQIVMSVEGSRGPIGGTEPGTAPALKVTALQLDLVPSSSGPLAAPKPVIVMRPIDAQSGPLADAVASNDRLQVVITTYRSEPVSGMPQRRVVRLYGARILFIHAAMDTTSSSRNELGGETIAFTYERIEVEDDGLRVFRSGS
jgi:hypothetical protein